MPIEQQVAFHGKFELGIDSDLVPIGELLTVGQPSNSYWTCRHLS